MMRLWSFIRYSYSHTTRCLFSLFPQRCRPCSVVRLVVQYAQVGMKPRHPVHYYTSHPTTEGALPTSGTEQNHKNILMHYGYIIIILFYTNKISCWPFFTLRSLLFSHGIFIFIAVLTSGWHEETFVSDSN